MGTLPATTTHSALSGARCRSQCSMNKLGPVDRSRRVVGLISRSWPGEIPTPTPALDSTWSAAKSANVANRPGTEDFVGLSWNATVAKIPRTSLPSQAFTSAGNSALTRHFARFAGIARYSASGVTFTTPPRTFTRPASAKRSSAALRRSLLRTCAGPKRRISLTFVGSPRARSHRYSVID